MCALRFVDSFDHYATADLTRKWTTATATNATVHASAGRNSTPGLRFTVYATTNVTKTIDAQATWVLGFAFRYSALPTIAATAIAGLRDAGTAQCSLLLNLDGTLSVVRSTSTAVTDGTSVAALSANIWYYVEWKVTVADSIAAGSCKVRLNGVDVITVATAQDLKATSNATANQLIFGAANSPGGAGPDYDDLYACDGTGAVNNDFLGDCMVTALYPDGAGNSTQWTPSAGSNYQNVDEASIDSDTTYNSTGGAGNIDLYTLGNLGFTPASVKGIQWVGGIRKDDASAYVLNRVVRTASTNYVGSTSIAPNTTYAFYHEVLELNPNTSAAWTGTQVDALEGGVKLVSVV